MSKTGIGDYEYSSAKPHAVEAVDNTSGLIPEGTQSVTYNLWGKVSEVNAVVGSDTYRYELTYGPDLQRVLAVLWKNNSLVHLVTYGRDYEEKYVGSDITRYYYVNGTDGNAAVYTSNSSGSKAYCMDMDHLGSVIGLYDQYGTKCYGASFDPWGKRTLMSGSIEFDRGFTGHEHIDEINLIDMNGRMYDPNIGRFLSPDNYIQSHGNPQNYNRYSYCLNNPLKYIDPTGDKIQLGKVFSYQVLAPILPPGTITTLAIHSAARAVHSAINGAIAGVIKGTNVWDEAKNKAINSIKIDLGLFNVNENLPPSLNGLLLTSRFTGELRQTLYGNTIAHIRNDLDLVTDVSYSNGATLVNRNRGEGNRWGFTLGPYINSKNLSPELCNDAVFRHEYGHTIQSAIMGPGYMHFVAIPSLIGSGLARLNDDPNITDPKTVNDHSKEWYETQASKFADLYGDIFNYPISDSSKEQWDEKFSRHYRLSWFWFTFAPPVPFFWTIGFAGDSIF